MSKLGVATWVFLACVALAVALNPAGGGSLAASRIGFVLCGIGVGFLLGVWWGSR